MLKKGLGQTMLLVILAFVLVLSACSNNNNEPAATETETPENTPAVDTTEQEPAELERVNLIWHYIGPPQDDIKIVEEAVNKILLEKINATVSLKAGDWTYQDKMNPIVAAGEEMDILWTSSWSFNYVQNAQRGAFLAIDDLVDKYMPKTREIIPSYAWNGVKVKGKLYGVPSYQIMAQNPGYIVRKGLADKYSFDPTTVKNVRDIEPFFEQVKNGEPGMTPLAIAHDSGIWHYFSSKWNYTLLDTVGAIEETDSTLKVVNGYETAAFKESLDITRDWYLKGYIHKDAALNNIREIGEKGLDAVTIHSTLKPGGNIGLLYKPDKTREDAVYAPIVDSYIPATAAQSTVNAISRTSKNPERALMLLELVNSDKELFNLIANGIEGVHYNKIDDKYIKKVEGSKYRPDSSWVFGNVFNDYLLEGMSPTVHEDTIKLNEESKPSIIMGFIFDQEPVKTQIANVKGVKDAFLPILLTGSDDPNKILPEFLSKLKEAGAEDIVVELQKQIDAWKTTK